ncbi:MAG TPA: glycosyltransferase family 2 protein [Kouleothrix sp.]|nr:glycosyltransferase family 2 protein [Kouleothrix sp.]
MPALAIVIVSWNTRALLHRAIVTVHASLAGAGIAYQIIVVDNASHDGTPAMLRAAHPEVELIEAGANLGFAGGNNLALRKLLPAESAPTPDVQYVLLLNPDTETVGDAIPQLVRYLAANPDVVAVGPQLRYPDGSVQSSRRRFPTRGVYFWESTPLAQRWPNNPWARRYRCTDMPDDREQAADWLVGAALLVRCTAIERAGLLDAGFAMYSEELEWQRRLGRFGKIVYVPSAVIIHHEGKSSEQAPAQRYLNFQHSRVRDAAMVYGPRFASLLRWFLRTAYAAELATEAAKWLVGHKRPLRAQRVGVYWRVLRGL